MRWFLGIIINAILFIAISGFFKDYFFIKGFGAALGASFILAILNLLVRPILIILTFPITVVTLGLFLLVINGLTLFMTDALMGDAFEIQGFGMTVLIAVIMSIANLIIQEIIFEKK